MSSFFFFFVFFFLVVLNRKACSFGHTLVSCCLCDDIHKARNKGEGVERKRRRVQTSIWPSLLCLDPSYTHSSLEIFPPKFHTHDFCPNMVKFLSSVTLCRFTHSCRPTLDQTEVEKLTYYLKRIGYVVMDRFPLACSSLSWKSLYLKWLNDLCVMKMFERLMLALLMLVTEHLWLPRGLCQGLLTTTVTVLLNFWRMQIPQQSSVSFEMVNIWTFGTVLTLIT